MAVLDDVSKDRKLVLYPHRIDWVERLPVAWKAEGEVVPIETSEPLKSECAHFLDCIPTHQQPRTDSAEGLWVLQVLEACQRSLDQKGTPIKMASLAASPPERPYFVHETAVIDQPSESARVARSGISPVYSKIDGSAKTAVSARTW